MDIGFTSTHIKDFDNDFITEIPPSVAAEWISRVCPEANLSGRGTIDDVINKKADIFDVWLNKLFVIVGHSHNKYIALYLHDNKFSVRMVVDNREHLY